MTGRVLLASLHLLDHQLVDRDGALVGKIDDLELRVGADETVTLTALLSGPGVLAVRLGHATYGRWRERVEAAVDGPGRRTSRIPMRHVRRITSAVELSLPAALLANFGTEQWVGDHVIGRIPGGRRLPDDRRAGGEGSVPPEQSFVQSAAELGDQEEGEGVGTFVRVSTVLRREVVDASGSRLGHVLDVRMVQDGPVGVGFDAAIRLDGLVVGYGRAPQRAGLFRHKVHGPWLLRQVARLASPHRTYVRWNDLLLDTIVDGERPIVASGEQQPVPGE